MSRLTAASAHRMKFSIMEPTNDHERVIAQAVNEKFLEDPGNRHHSIVRDIAISLDFIMSPSDSQFLVRCVQWRLTHPISPSNSKEPTTRNRHP
jgi:hypothetical protein